MGAWKGHCSGRHKYTHIVKYGGGGQAQDDDQ